MLQKWKAWNIDGEWYPPTHLLLHPSDNWAITVEKYIV